MKTIKLAVIISLLLLCFNANSTVIYLTGASDPNLNGMYDISTTDKTFAEFQPVLETQIWWGDQSLASLFAKTLEIGFGNVTSSGIGPLFAYGTSGSNFLMMACETYSVTINSCGAGGQLAGYQDRDTRLFTFATATRVPEPGSLAVMLVGLIGLLMGRQSASKKR